jgi:hypothetical protein
MSLRRTEHGIATIYDPDADRPVLEQGTVQCVHCSGHFAVKPGSGKVRGWCHNCCGPVCGPQCAACVPFQQMLENMEKGRPLDFKPIIVPASF